ARFKTGLRDMSMRFGESTETLSKGLYDILSASVAPAKALSVLEVSSRAATAGMTDTGTAADLVTTILNSYSLSADKAGVVSDLLFTIVKRGKTTFPELAESLGMVASTAASGNVSLQELGAGMAVLTRAGIKTANATTALNAIVSGFLKPTDDAVAAAEKFKIKLNSTTLETEGLVGVLEKLRDAGPEAIAAIFPNIRALRGVLPAINQLEGMRGDLEAMHKSAGATDEQFAKMSRTMDMQLRRLREGFRALGVALGSALAPGVRYLTDRLVPGLQTATKMLENHALGWKILKVGIKLEMSELHDWLKWMLSDKLPDLWKDFSRKSLTHIDEFGRLARKSVALAMDDLLGDIAGVPDAIKDKIKKKVAGGGRKLPGPAKPGEYGGYHGGAWDVVQGANPFSKKYGRAFMTPRERAAQVALLGVAGAAGGAAVGLAATSSLAYTLAMGAKFGGTGLAAGEIPTLISGQKLPMGQKAALRGMSGGAEWGMRSGLMMKAAGGSFLKAGAAGAGIGGLAVMLGSAVIDGLYTWSKNRSAAKEMAAALPPGKLGMVAGALGSMMLAATGGPQASATTQALRAQLDALLKELYGPAAAGAAKGGGLGGLAGAVAGGGGGAMGGWGADTPALAAYQSRFMTRSPGQGEAGQWQQMHALQRVQVTRLERIGSAMGDLLEKAREQVDLLRARLPEMQVATVNN
ncbi:MAG: phage tail tape measure protein, partial [Pseudomonadota bacterium]